jgi:high-affinity nickel permease
MKTEQEIQEKIKEVEKSYRHVLDGTMATVFENAPRALMQLSATAILDGLYFALGKKRPRYEHEKSK